VSHQHSHHGQRGSHGHDIDWAERGAELVTAAEVGAPAVNLALDWLVERLPAATAVMDIGAGPGVAACALATRLPDARVLAVDGAKPLLALARERAERLGVADRVTVRLADLPAGLADLPPADLVWVSGVVHHLPDPVATLRTLGALVRRGGLLAIREGGLPARFLPDGLAPGLLPRLEAITEELVAAGGRPSGILPHEGGWPDLMRAAGLSPAGSRTFLLDLPPPLSAEARGYVQWQLEMARESVGEHLTPGDAGALATLLDSASPEGVMQRPDIFLLSASTIHTAAPAV
jgi:SAM-dependent methyltransferase